MLFSALKLTHDPSETSSSALAWKFEMSASKGFAVQPLHNDDTAGLKIPFASRLHTRCDKNLQAGKKGIAAA